MLFVERKLRRILKSQDHDVPLRRLAEDLGCSLESTYDMPSGKHLEARVVARIREAARSQREARLYWIAVIAAVASALSAFAAWCAVRASKETLPEPQNVPYSVGAAPDGASPPSR